MVNWKLSSLLLISLRALNAFAAIEVENVEEIVDDAQTPNLQVSVSVSFPQSEIFGVKLINGHATEARLAVTNNEPDPISVALVGGSLVKDGPEPQILRNLTSKQYMLEVPAGEEETIPYSFSTEMHPQDVRLQLMAVLKDKKNAFYTVSIYNETVSIVEAPTSIFDPQIIFLYIVILGAFGGTVYFIYNTWITTFFPQKKRSGRSSEPRPKKVVPADTNLEDTDGPAVSTGSKPYDESWIPAAHLQRPEAKRVRSGTPKTKAKA